MKIIGITGGVGCGKSSVLSYLRDRYHFEVLEADEVARRLEEPYGACYARIISAFGREILTDEDDKHEVKGSARPIDRERLAKIVFEDEEKLKILNGIVHPAVKEEIKRKVKDARNSGGRCLFIAAAVFFEESYDKMCDEVWYVFADEKTRAKRLRASRGYDEKKIGLIMRSQLTGDVFLKRCDRVIDNSGSFYDTRLAVDDAVKDVLSNL